MEFGVVKVRTPATQRVHCGAMVDGDFSFSPAHTLTAHRPLGGINRARLEVCGVMASIRRRDSGLPQTEPSAADQVPA